MNSGRQEITPRHEDSFAQTMRSDQDLRFASRQSNRINGPLSDSPTDESTLPNPRNLPVQNLLSPIQPSPHVASQRLGVLSHNNFSDKSLADLNVTPVAQSTLKTPTMSYVEEHDSHVLIEHLQQSITTVEAHMYIIQEHAKQQMHRLNEQYKNREEQLDIAIDMLAGERITLEQEKAALSTQLANTRVELKNTKDQLRQERDRRSGDAEDLSQKFKDMSNERTKLQSELSGLKVKHNDARRTITDQKNQIETLEAKLKKANETNSKLMTSNSSIRIQNERLQQNLNQLEQQTRQIEISRPTPDSAASSSVPLNRRLSLSNSRQNLSARSVNDIRPASALATGRQSRPASSLRFSNRTQVRDITPPPFSSLIEHEQPNSPQEIGSEIHTTSCRDHCHLFEHEGDEGRFRWVCGINEHLIVLYREQRYVVFVPDIAEIQFFGDGPNKGQIVVFWASQSAEKEITVLHTNGVREEYRIGADGGIVYREVFNFNGPAFRITGDETVQIDLSEATPLTADVRATQTSQTDIQLHHPEFGLRIVNFEFLRIQIVAERLQITMCLCDNRRVFNVKHCSDDFKQKSLCAFLGQCSNMPVR